MQFIIQIERKQRIRTIQDEIERKIRIKIENSKKNEKTNLWFHRKCKIANGIEKGRITVYDKDQEVAREKGACEEALFNEMANLIKSI